MSINWEEHIELRTLRENLETRFTESVFLGGRNYSKVFQLINHDAHRSYVLKVLNMNRLMKLGLEERKEILLRFVKEAGIYKALNHPNVVKTYEINRKDNFPYLLMEFVDGKNLDELLAERGVLEFKEILRISRAILSALGYIHKKGLVHGYLKPSNIIVESYDGGRCVIVDFGIVKNPLSLPLTTKGITIGVPHYMAPEQWRSAETETLWTDIYTFGILLFKMVTGEVPFDGSLPEIMAAHFAMPIPRIQKKKPNVSLGIQEIIEKAMAKKPEDRYNSTGDFLNDLLDLENPMR
ncbi:MAG: serine/threonine protein kinase [Candidatus Aminicenantes bacterium]|nr:serine/threonine protein kinase [Candidatus Aminicenantes bacterium]